MQLRFFSVRDDALLRKTARPDVKIAVDFRANVGNAPKREGVSDGEEDFLRRRSRNRRRKARRERLFPNRGFFPLHFFRDASDESHVFRGRRRHGETRRIRGNAGKIRRIGVGIDENDVALLRIRANERRRPRSVIAGKRGVFVIRGILRGDFLCPVRGIVIKPVRFCNPMCVELFRRRRIALPRQNSCGNGRSFRRGRSDGILDVSVSHSARLSRRLSRPFIQRQRRRRKKRRSEIPVFDHDAFRA